MAQGHTRAAEQRGRGRRGADPGPGCTPLLPPRAWVPPRPARCRPTPRAGVFHPSPLSRHPAPSVRGSRRTSRPRAASEPTRPRRQLWVTGEHAVGRRRPADGDAGVPKPRVAVGPAALSGVGTTDAMLAVLRGVKGCEGGALFSSAFFTFGCSLGFLSKSKKWPITVAWVTASVSPPALPACGVFRGPHGPRFPLPAWGVAPAGRRGAGAARALPGAAAALQ